jgi:HK97 family phage major capsid protein
MLATYVAEIEERRAFIDGVVQAAQEKGEDLGDDQNEMITRASERIRHLNDQMKPLEESRRIGDDSAERIAQISKYLQNDDRPRSVEYRSAGEYAVDLWRAGLGNDDARHRLDTFNRAAAHQTTGDNPGLLPQQILGPVVNFIDAARPLVSALGARQLPSGSWSRPKVTQHTQVGAQAGEKTELPSRKMTISKLPVTALTLGGYVNVSRQDIDWTQPSVMDIVINDLAAEYALVAEQTAVQAFYTGSTAGPTIAAGPTSNDVAAALWTAAGNVYTATRGQGQLVACCSPDVLGLLGPLFAPINPIDAQSQGFSANTFGQGVMGAISGITIAVSAGFAAAKSLMVLSTAAAEVYEDRIGSLQVVEPSVLGIQVAYAGYFAPLIMEATGIQKVTVT